MINRVTLVGRLGQDPTTRHTNSGQAVCNFTMATDESYKDRNGEKQQRTEWHRLVAWGKLAEIIQQYLTKGSLVYIEGKLQTRQWEDKDGAAKQTTEIVASTMKMLGGGGDKKAAGTAVKDKLAAKSANRGGYRPPKAAPKAAPQEDDPMRADWEIEGEDIPF